MVIREMSREECLRVLAGARLARLACAHDNQPYIVPVYLAYHEASRCLYGFTTPGQKIEWMRANPLVRVEVDEVADHDQWMSVIASGRYEELPDFQGNGGERLRALERPQHVVEAMPAWSAHSRNCQCDDERHMAWQVLKTLPMWWQPASTVWAARAHRDSGEPFIPVYYKIRIERVTGHEATRDAGDANSCAMPAPPNERWRWLRRALSRVFGGRS
jgi:nitroimidazol reductase NimA-like FMN-containing flavoprotein (pyridoxamine 5'-phosphate oxidase superfamily)